MRFKSIVLGKIAYYITLWLGKSLSVTTVKAKGYDPHQQYLFAFWHGKQLMPVMQLIHHGTGRAVLVSASRDGDLLTVWLRYLGYTVVRGSSRRHNISALVGMSRKF